MNRSRTASSVSACSQGSDSGADASWQRLEPVQVGGGPGALAQDSQLDGQAHRCTCGSLLARLVAGGVELKCRRCKRIVLLRFPTEASR